MSVALDLPPRLLEASAPPERRGLARDGVRMLLSDRAAAEHAHRRFFDLPSLLRAGDVLVVNDSATLPSALRARRANGESLQLHVSTAIDRRLFMAEPRAKVTLGEELRLPDGGSVVMIAPVEPERPRLWYAWFDLPLEMHAYLMQVGEPIRYGYVHERFPLRDYQTIFARELGSSEMPSAGRPFTERVMRELSRSGVQIVSITLHCGVGSFEAPERPSAERFAISPESAAAINAARRERRRVIAVGTTVVRALETALRRDDVVASAGWTDLIIDGNRVVRSVDGLLTGFHDSGATHRWMLRAFLTAELLADASRKLPSTGTINTNSATCTSSCEDE